MGVKVMMPQKQQQTSIGRRLFGMGATALGGAYGGPAGAAVGGMIGGKIAGQDTNQALMSGMESAVGGLSKGKSTEGMTESLPDGQLNLSEKLQMPQIGDSAFNRRMNSLQQDPVFAINQGLDALTYMPDDMRKQYTAPLVQARMLGGRNAGSGSYT